MPTQLKRSLFIGLGGTGMTALLHTKKLFIDTFREVPPMIAFLGIDTDQGQFTNSLRLRNGYEVSLDNDEQLKATVSFPKPVYEANHNQMGWMPDENVKYIKGLKTGAGQIRTNGRFAVWYHHQQIKDQILACINKITNATHIDNTKYENLQSEIEIHVIFSLCGGTGAGMFLNLGYLIQQDIKPTYPCKTAAYAVLPEIFYAMNPTQMPRVHANAFGALEDLDWLMKANPLTQKFEISNLNHSYSTNDTPYDVVLLIDNRNSHGDTIENPNILSQMISLAMVVGAGNIGKALSSVMDNMIQDIANGTMDVADKKAWAGGLGVSEIVLESQDLYQAYILRVSSILVNKLNSDNNPEDVDTTANAWIDATTIRENQGQDQVIDYLLSKTPRFPVPEIANPQNPESTTSTWLGIVTTQQEAAQQTLDEKVNNRFEEAIVGLDALVNEHLNNGNGVGFVLNLLGVIKAQMEICLQEMQDELNGKDGEIGFKGKKAVRLAAYDSAVEGLKSYRRPLFGRNLTDEKKNEAQSAAMAFAINEREISRREKAINFYNRFIQELNRKENVVKGLSESLSQARNNINNELSQLVNGINRDVQLFQIDLTKEYISRVKPTAEDVILSSFINSLQAGNIGNIIGVELMANIQPNEICNIFQTYAGTLQQAVNYKNMSVEDLLQQLSDEKVNDIVKSALRKSSPLFQYDHNNIGILPEQRPNTYFYIGVENQDTEQMKGFMQKVNTMITGGHHPQFVNTGHKNRIIFYCQEGVIPPCVLSNIRHLEERANAAPCNVHFDKIIENRMEREQYSIFPKQNQFDPMEIWIKGLMFGFIRNNGGTFEMKDMTTGQAIDGYWTSLNNTIPHDRSQAFASFRQQMNSTIIRNSFQQMMDKKASHMGGAILQSLIDDVKANFVNNYAQIGLLIDEIKNMAIYANIREQLNSEIEYVDQKLHI